ncbi:MAG: hypothetical protein R6X19_02275 [Kiritimatiellia bacterium]
MTNSLVSRAKVALFAVLGLMLLLAWVGHLNVDSFMEWRKAKRTRQARVMLREATTDRDGVTYFSNSPQASHVELDARIPKLIRALELDPVLTEAHFWLGQYGLDRLTMPNASNATLSLVASLSQLKTYIREQPNDGKAHSLSYASEWKSRSPGALREKAWHSLIWSACKLCPKPPESGGKLVLPDSSDGVSNRVFEAFRDRFSSLVSEYLLEKPRKTLSDHLHHIPPMFMRPPMAREPQRVIEWYRFIDHIYGADHLAYNVPCPFEDAARALDNMGESNLAREVRESPDRKHCINRVEVSTVDPEREAQQDWEPDLSAPLLPSAWRESVDSFPTNAGRVQFLVRVGTTRYLVMGAPGASLWGARRESFKRRVFRQGVVSGEVEEIPLSPKDEPVFVTSVISQGAEVWFSTLDGIVRYEPETRTLKWLKESGTFPGAIMSGIAAEGLLWFAGKARNDNLHIIRVDPTTFAVRMFSPGFVINSVEGLSWVFGRLLIRSLTNTYWLDPVSGLCQGVPFQAVSPIVACAGSYWVITVRGLEKIVDSATLATTLVLPFRDAGGDPNAKRLLPDPPAAPKMLRPGEHIGMTGDGETLWISIGENLSAYEPGRDLLLGPYAMTEGHGAAPLFIEEGSLWSVVSSQKKDAKTVIRVSTGAFRAAAKKK